jgi:MFS family permease
MNGIAGFKGWQWMFILEGVPSIFLGLVVLKFLTDTPAKAKWLEPEQRDWLVNEMMGFWAKHSDTTGERYWHVALATAVGGGGLLLAALFHEYYVLVVMLLSIAIAGVMAARPPFWAMPSDFLTGAKAAASIAAINSIGNLGGFLGPYLIGWARETTGSFTAGLMISAATLLASAMFVISLRRSTKLSLLQPPTQR